jgi:two-component system phosphate regulon sensor histidine kinase PhoR
MNQKIFRAVLIITTAALLGIIAMQAYWMMDAFKLKESQFGHRVKIALKNVVDDMMFNQPDSIKMTNRGCSMDCDGGMVLFDDCVKPHLLDSLIHQEFKSLSVNRAFNYGVINKTTHQISFGNIGKYSEELFKSEHSISLSCLYRPEMHVLTVYFPAQSEIIISQMLGWLIVSFLLLIVLIAGFAYSVVSLMKQKKLSEMKADFVNNMTHEFKTPISTISLASEMLMNPTVAGDLEKTQRYANIIQSENSRLRKQVEQVLQLAVLDKGEYSLKKREIDVHKVIEHLIKSFSLIVKKRKGDIKVEFMATNSIIVADKDHFSNVIMNLLDNAEKYSHCAPLITVSTRNVSNGIVISVEDKGIGISLENQKQVFRNLYRVPTGNIHNVKGFGIGLYYSRTIIEAHQGTINLHSEPRKGSRFEVFLPFDQIKTDEQER